MGLNPGPRRFHVPRGNQARGPQPLNAVHPEPEFCSKRKHPKEKPAPQNERGAPTHHNQENVCAAERPKWSQNEIQTLKNEVPMLFHGVGVSLNESKTRNSGEHLGWHFIFLLKMEEATFSERERDGCPNFSEPAVYSLENLQCQGYAGSARKPHGKQQ